MLAKIKESVDYILSHITNKPQAGIVLGSGLGNLATKIEVDKIIPYHEIPNFPVSTVKGHKSNLIFGTLGGKYVVAMQGRLHYYEGWSMEEITFPLRVMKMLGVSMLVLSNASGGMNPLFNIGDIMLITDHINLMNTNPLIGPNIEELGPRFPEMKEAYDKHLIEKVREVAFHEGIPLQSGVYAAVTGPTFETPAEYKFFHIIGADAVGMSTVPEVIVAKHMSVPVVALSVITDLGIVGRISDVSHDMVLQAAQAAEPLLTKIIVRLLQETEL